MKTGGYGDISLRMIEIFIAAAEHNSFSKAATTLFLSQSVVSRNIQSLEDNLGISLFKRTNQGVKLTSEGYSLYMSFKQILNMITEMITDTKAGRQVDREKTVRVGCLRAEGAADAFEMLQNSYKRVRPDVSFDVTFMDYQNLRQGLVCKELDCIVTYSLGFGKLWNVSTKRVRRMDSYFAVSAKHPMAKNGNFRPSGLNGHPMFLISLAEMEAAEKRALTICREYDIEPKIEYVASRSDVEVAVKNNRGFTIDGVDFSKHYPNDIKLFKIENPSVNQYVIICWHDEHCPSYCREFLDWISGPDQQ